MLETKRFILQKVRVKGRVKTSEIVKALKLSRQTVVQHLRELVQAGKLIKLGSTRAAVYIIPSRTTGRGVKSIPPFTAHYRIRGLEEDRVFRQAAMALNLKQALSTSAFKIVNYAFTEMLNNAIEHSKSRMVQVSLRCAKGEFTFEVIDRGIGAFESIRKKFGFKNHFEAAEHLLKGKQTVDPKHHTGQGIFFTSKIADRFVLRSANLKLIIDNGVDDVFLEDARTFRGTGVFFSLKQKSRKDLKTVFDEFSNDQYDFDKTKILVRLSEAEGEHVSRSQAKRLLFGLDQFRRIIFDFKKVKGIGQGFADEVFRVFAKANPGIKLEAIHVSPAVEFMLERAKKVA